MPGLVEAMEERVFVGGAPFLGICVGMQLLATRGRRAWRDRGARLDRAAKCCAIERTDPAIKVPHMGWNDVDADRRIATAPALIEPGEAYFLHSYHFVPDEGRDIAAMTDHGGGIVAAVARDNIARRAVPPGKEPGLRAGAAGAVSGVEVREAAL